MLAFHAHMPPSVQDDQPAVALDELLMMHARVTKLIEEKKPDG